MIVFRFDGSERLRQQLGVDDRRGGGKSARYRSVQPRLPASGGGSSSIGRAPAKTASWGASIVSIRVNTARGGLVKEAHLVETLTGGHLAARLLALKNVVAAPHVAWLTRKTLERRMAAARSNAKRLRAGLPLADRIA